MCIRENCWFHKFAQHDNVFFSDKAWFHLNGYVNAQNMWYWESSYPLWSASAFWKNWCVVCHILTQNSGITIFWQYWKCGYLPRFAFSICDPVGKKSTLLMVSKGQSNKSHRYFNNGAFVKFLHWSHYFYMTLASTIIIYLTSRFFPVRILKGPCLCKEQAWFEVLGSKYHSFHRGNHAIYAEVYYEKHLLPVMQKSLPAPSLGTH